MIVQFALRRGTSAEWALDNPVLGIGEPGIDSDIRVLKVGDGVTPWNDLPAFLGGVGGGGSGGPTAWSEITGKPVTFAPEAHQHPASDIVNFVEALQDALASTIVAGSNMTAVYDDTLGTLTLNSTATGGAGTTDPEVVRDTIGTALRGSGLLTVTVNDAADTITLATTATANSTDAALRDRTTHTGIEPISGVAAGTLLVVQKTAGGVWPARPTSRPDVVYAWKGPDPTPAIVTSGTGGMLNGVDVRWVTT